MKKAVVVGGSSGIGLAITLKLISDDYKVIIVDRENPDIQEKSVHENIEFIKMDLTQFDEKVFKELSDDLDISLLMITAGFGRVTEFENISLPEIENMFMVNSVAAIKIFSIFYKRIMDKKPFYSGVMGSIAGLVSSPLFSVYAATKAAVCRFTESVNIELEETGTNNRILNVSPGSIKGTKFNGGPNVLSLTDELAKNILEHLYAQDDLFIPDYEEIFKDVIKRYQKDPHEYGLHSYEYKRKSGRIRS